MTRRVFIRRLVLNSICDDGENVDQIILSEVNEDAANYGLTIDRAEIVDVLAGLVEEAVATASILSPWEPGNYYNTFNRKILRDCLGGIR